MNLVRRWVALAVVPALVIGALTFLYVNHEPKIYESSATLYVAVGGGASSNTGSGTDTYTSQQLTATYSEMLSLPVIESDVDKVMGRQYPGYRLASHGVQISQPQALQSTQLIDVSVQDTDPRRSYAAVSAMVQVFRQHVARIEASRFSADEQALQNKIQNTAQDIQRTRQQMDQAPRGSNVSGLSANLATYENTYQALLNQSTQFTISSDAMKNAVSVASPAELPSSPVAPNPKKTALLAALAALVLFAGGIFVYEYFDDSIKTPEDVEAIVGAPILGIVTRFNTRKLGTQLITQKEPQAPASEAYRLVRTNLQFTNVDNPLRTLAIASARPSEGKSTTASNLALVLAEGGQNVVLVDADMRKPSQHSIFGVTRLHGLTNALVAGRGQGEDVDQLVAPQLRLVASGPLPPRPADLLGSSSMRSYISLLQRDADMVVFDAPPVLAAADTNILAAMVDGVILVVDPDKTTRRELERARDSLTGVGGKIVGVVLNRVEEKGGSYYYSYHYRSSPSEIAAFPDVAAAANEPALLKRQRLKS